MNTKPELKTAKPGPVHTGSTKTNDLFKPCLDCLLNLLKDNPNHDTNKDVEEWETWARYYPFNWNQLAADRKDELLDDLFFELEFFVPLGHYFGPLNDKEDSDVGFWPVLVTDEKSA